MRLLLYPVYATMDTQPKFKKGTIIMSDKQTESTMSQEDKDAFIFAAEGTLVDEIVKELADRDPSLITLPPKAHIHDGSYIITTFPGKYPTSQLVEILDETTKRYGTTTHNLFMRIGPNMLANLMLVKVENQDTDGIALDETLPGYCVSTLMENYDTVRIDINGIIYNCTQIDDNIEIPPDVLITSLKRMKTKLEHIIGTKLDLDIDETLGVDTDDGLNDSDESNNDDDDTVIRATGGFAVTPETIEDDDPTFKNINDVRTFVNNTVHPNSEYDDEIQNEIITLIDNIIDYKRGVWGNSPVRACVTSIDKDSFNQLVDTVKNVVEQYHEANLEYHHTEPTITPIESDDNTDTDTNNTGDTD